MIGKKDEDIWNLYFERGVPMLSFVLDDKEWNYLKTEFFGEETYLCMVSQLVADFLGWSR